MIQLNYCIILIPSGGDHFGYSATTGGLTDSLPTNGSDTDCALTAEGHGHPDCAGHSDCALSTEDNSDVATTDPILCSRIQ
jgi:hypothetical protein